MLNMINLHFFKSSGFDWEEEPVEITKKGGDICTTINMTEKYSQEIVEWEFTLLEFVY